MANVTSAVSGGVGSPRPSDLGFGPLADRSTTGGFPNNSAGMRGATVPRAGVSYAQERQKRSV